MEARALLHDIADSSRHGRNVERVYQHFQQYDFQGATQQEKEFQLFREQIFLESFATFFYCHQKLQVIQHMLALVDVQKALQHFLMKDMQGTGAQTRLAEIWRKQSRARINWTLEKTIAQMIHWKEKGDM